MMAAALHQLVRGSALRLRARTKSPRLCLSVVAISSLWRSPAAESFAFAPWRCHQHAPRHPRNRSVHLPPSNGGLAASPSDGEHNSVTGPIYEVEGGPSVKLFTKEGCTLCDKVKDVLESVREEQPHSLYAVDITDEDKQEWFSKYKYDIPVLHINDVYWAKHRLSAEEAVAGIGEAREGEFAIRQGEPDASRLEHN